MILSTDETIIILVEELLLDLTRTTALILMKKMDQGGNASVRRLLVGILRCLTEAAEFSDREQ